MKIQCVCISLSNILIFNRSIFPAATLEHSFAIAFREFASYECEWRLRSMKHSNK